MFFCFFEFPRKSNEHYPDPTFGEAYSNIRKAENSLNSGEKFIPWVYIASPYRGDVAANVENAKRYSLFATLRGKMPMCPHVYFTQFLDDNNEYERRRGLELALQMLKRCAEMWVFGEKISSGMQNEIKAAEKWNIPIKYFDENCEVAEP